MSAALSIVTASNTLPTISELTDEAIDYGRAAMTLAA
jgi:hypothetical protein